MLHLSAWIRTVCIHLQNAKHTIENRIWLLLLLARICLENNVWQKISRMCSVKAKLLTILAYLNRSCIL